MVGTPVNLWPTTLHVPPGHIHLAPDDGFDAVLHSLLVEAEGAVHHAMVGDSQSVHPQFSRTLNQVFDAAQAVQQGVLAMHVEMYKLSHCVELSEDRTSRGWFGLIIAQNGVGARVKLGASGIEEVVEISLTEEEQAALKKSADAVTELKGVLAGIDY